MTKPVSLAARRACASAGRQFSRGAGDAHARCYRPFLHTLHRYPGFRFAAHFSGWLLEYLFDHYPEDMALLRAMVERGQVELFGGGDTEPVLAAIPTRDRIGQIAALSDRWQRLARPPSQGRLAHRAGMGEQPWSQRWPTPASDTSTVDDYHFLCSGKDAAELDGYFTTEEDGRSSTCSPSPRRLRYRIPFAPAARNRRLSSNGMASNPGIAPRSTSTTSKSSASGRRPMTGCTRRAGCSSSSRRVLASRPITHRSTSANIARRRPTRGRGLSADHVLHRDERMDAARGTRAHAYADLVEAARRITARYERDKALLRGGIWSNFLSRYSEANWMHKRMLALSRGSRACLPRCATRAPARQLLYRAQANDAYWHGLFGGLYLPHLRRAVYNAMVELEGMLDAACAAAGDSAPRRRSGRRRGSVPAQRRPASGGALDGDAAIIELDAYSLRHNFGDTLRRHEEHYYRKTCSWASTHRRTQGEASPRRTTASLQACDLAGGHGTRHACTRSVSGHLGRPRRTR